MVSFGLQVMTDPWEGWTWQPGYGWVPSWLQHQRSAPPPPPPPPPSTPHAGAPGPRYLPQPPPPGTTPPRPYLPEEPEEEGVQRSPGGLPDFSRPDWWNQSVVDSDSEESGSDSEEKSKDKQYKVLLGLVSKASPEIAKKKPLSGSRLLRKEEQKVAVLHETDLIKDTYHSVLKENFKTLVKSDPWKSDSGEGKNPPFKANKRPNISERPYKVEESSVRPLKSPKLDKDWSDLSSKKPFKNQSFERMESWEDNIIRSINMVNQMEVFSMAVNEKVELAVDTLEKCYKLIGEIDQSGVLPPDMKAAIGALPQSSELTDAVRLMGTFNDSRAQTLEHLARRLQWQQIDLILARRDIMVDLLPGDMPEALKDLMRNFPIEKYKLFGNINEVKEKWNRRTEAKASRSFYLSSVYEKKKGGGERGKKSDKQGRGQTQAKTKDWNLSFRRGGAEHREKKRFQKSRAQAFTKKAENSDRPK